MESQSAGKESIFDLVEEQGSDPETFCWNPVTPLRILGADCLLQGQLHTFQPSSGDDIVRHYALTLDGLYRSGDGCAENEVGELTEFTAILRFRNPRVFRLKEVRPGLYPSYNKTSSCGFRLVGYKASFEFFCASLQDFQAWMEKLKRVCVGAEVSANYTIGKLIGKGSTAQVRLVTRNSDGAKFALKTFEVHKLQGKPSMLTFLSRELDILRRVNHPAIIKLYEVYEDKLYIHMVIEYLQGGDLLSHLGNKGVYSEKDASTATRKVLEALEYCHSRNIIHRDLKPENLIMVDTSNDYELKIADFGLATFTTSGTRETVRCGSPGYVAPEVLLKLGYNTKADIFSAGVILFAM